jgi:hypothetical protein
MLPMSTPEANGVPPDVLRDAEIVAAYLETGQPVPADVAHRVQARADAARERLLAMRGVQSSGVDIIREIRGELPNP